MQTFTVSHTSPLSVPAAWARLTDWPAHGRWVPLTSIEVTTGDGDGVGSVFTARTAVGRVGFEDPMEIVAWQPPTGDEPGRCRLEKRGTVILGWAELSVERDGAGSRSTWTEAARPSFAPAFTDRVTVASSRLLFGRVLRKLLAT